MRAKTLLSICGALALAAAATTNVGAQGFRLQTGPPVAAMPDPESPGAKKFKDVAFVVRPAGCADLATFRVTAIADGALKGVRRALPLRIIPLPQPGAFALVGHETTGTWVVSVSGTCGSELAGATVRLIDGAYRREHVELLPRHPTQADVERAMARTAGGGQE
jgi:hypothetical protein